MAKIYGECSICRRYDRLARGWCTGHYWRWRKYGDPNRGRAVRPVQSVIKGDTDARVVLTQGYEAVVDLCDAQTVAAYKWHAVKDKHTVYAQTSIKDEDGVYRKIGLHTLLMGRNGGKLVDHKDGDGLNNRRNNLRFATASQNQANKRVSKNNTSGFKGVRFASWATGRNRWRASISVGGEYKSLGYFSSAEEAAMAYDRSAVKHFGDYAHPNFKGDGGYHR